MADASITHQPVLSRQGKFIASRLRIHVASGEGDPTANIVDTFRNIDEYWPTGQQFFFLNFGDSALTPELFDWLVPENATLELRPKCLEVSTREALAQAIHENSAVLCLDFDDHIAHALNIGFSFRFTGFDAQTYTPQQMQTLAIKLKTTGTPIAFDVATPAAFKACTDAGMHACSGWFCKTPVSAPAKVLAPNQAHIVRLLNLVRNNADVSQIEMALKRDVALSYKLLRYINSAGFGLSCEIQSFRHAVTMLGYDKLHKWLSLLLVTASKDAMAPAVMHAALTRARLMEILGHGLVDKGEIDNLFIAGAFSMLDVLLGVTMEKAMAEMHLPEAITEALMARSGPYAPFYEIALACETNDGERLPALADSLGLDTTRVNAALMQSLAFAATMSSS